MVGNGRQREAQALMGVARRIQIFDGEHKMIDVAGCHVPS
jgi:hypothetical protein